MALRQEIRSADLDLSQNFWEEWGGVVDAKLAEVGATPRAAEHVRSRIGELLGDAGLNGDGEEVITGTIDDILSEMGEEDESSPDYNWRERNLALQKAQEFLAKNSEAQKVILSKLEAALSEGQTMEEYNGEGVAELTCQQLNDIATQFLFYFLKEHGELGLNDQLLILDFLYCGLDFEATQKHFGRIEKRDKQKYGFPDDLEARYHRIGELLGESGRMFFLRFLKSAKFNSNRTRDLLQPWNANFFEERNQALKHVQLSSKKGDRTRRGVGYVEQRLLGNPTCYANAFMDVDAVLLQRGNVTAKNRMATALWHLSGYLTARLFYQIQGRQEGTFEDIVQSGVEKTMQVCYGADLKKGSVINYMWQIILSYFQRLKAKYPTVPIPYGVQELIDILYRDGERFDKMTDAEVSETIVLATGKPRFSPEIVHIARQTRPAASWEKPMQNGKGKVRTLGTILEAKIQRAPAIDAPSNDVLLKGKFAEVLGAMPREDAALLKYMMTGVTMEEASKAGPFPVQMSREGIRRRLQGTLDRLVGVKSDLAEEGLSTEHIVIIDETAFQEWLAQEESDPFYREAYCDWIGANRDCGYYKFTHMKSFFAYIAPGFEHLTGDERVTKPALARLRKLNARLKKKLEAGGNFARFVTRGEAYGEARGIIAKTNPDFVFGGEPLDLRKLLSS